MNRLDGRASDELRPVTMIPGFQSFAEGSVFIEVGATRVICSVSAEDQVPKFLKGQGKGWITAEYGMLPCATLSRFAREASLGKVGGRTQEIQRLIGRSLRSITNLDALGERTLTIDCDVIQADGGTRTAAITGSYVALYLALQNLFNKGCISSIPIIKPVAATSVGIVEGVHLLDLCYNEDYRAEVDFNVVMTDDGHFVELQGTAETMPFTREAANSLIDLAQKGINELFIIQQKTIAAAIKQ